VLKVLSEAGSGGDGGDMDDPAGSASHQSASLCGINFSLQIQKALLMFCTRLA